MKDLISQLGIEWKILIAQVINFGILFFVLRHFLYKPIIKTLDKRKHGVIKEKEGREDLEVKMQDLLKTKQEMLQKTRKESSDIIKNAEITAAKMKNQILEDAKNASDKIQADSKKAMEIEKVAMMRDIKQQIGSLVALSIEKTLGDVLDEKAENRLATGAMEKIAKS